MNQKTIIGLVSTAVLVLIVGGLLWALEENGAVPSTGEPVATTTPNPITPLPYGAVTLRLGEKATFQDVSIRPVSIEEDSRCPQDVQCIQAGTVQVKVAIAGRAGTDTQIIGLGKSLATENETISFNAALPAKISTVPLMPADYILTFTVTKRAAVTGGCFVGGCSSQICSDQPGAISTCEYRAEYACYKSAVCERQQNGQCGWTDTTTLRACLLNPPSL